MERKALYFEYGKHDTCGSVQCTVHGIFQKNTGYESGPVAIIETDDGNVKEVSPDNIQFTDKY